MICQHCSAQILTEEQVCLRCGWRPPTPAPGQRLAQPGELLFEFMRGYDRIRCELRDHGPVYGVEAQFVHDGFPVSCRTFNPRLDPTRTPREMAIQWAKAERRAMEG